MLSDIQKQFNDEILHWAASTFGFELAALEPLEGSAFVYAGQAGGQERILKIVPGIWNTAEVLMGSTREQLLGELDFVLYLARHGLPVALPYPAEPLRVEQKPLGPRECFLAYAFEKAPGELYPDADLVEFPAPLLEQWGRLCGQLHRLSMEYVPARPDYRRLAWDRDDLLDYAALVPPELPQIRARYAELLAQLHALPQSREGYGLLHGDFHHGNFLVDAAGEITIFDFDAARYGWFISELCLALYNCLPLPRSQAALRREYTLHYLCHFLRGYRQARPLAAEWIARIPLFLKYCELLNYAYFCKYWERANLSEHRQQILQELEQRIVAATPVVEFQPGDLEHIVATE